MYKFLYACGLAKDMCQPATKDSNAPKLQLHGSKLTIQIAAAILTAQHACVGHEVTHTQSGFG